MFLIVILHGNIIARVLIMDTSIQKQERIIRSEWMKVWAVLAIVWGHLLFSILDNL